jgi:hypothetical protein
MRGFLVTLIIDLPEDQVDALKAKAASAGLTLEAWFSQLAAEMSAGKSGMSVMDLQKRDPQEWARRFRAWADGHDPNLPVLSDDAMSRENIYPDPA